MIRAGIPQDNKSLYHALRFSVGDPVALLEIGGGDDSAKRVVIIRDVELDRARRSVRADEIVSLADYEPEGGLSADREIATAQAAAECLSRQGASRHEHGSGVLRTGEPVIVDIFPMDRGSQYWGDCTRSVVHGEIPETVAAMHRAVVAAKAASLAVLRAGVTGREVHAATARTILSHGFSMVAPDDEGTLLAPGMPHGTGHGIGLSVHEPPLLDEKGGELLAGDVVTVEPALFQIGLGGVRVEDMVLITDTGFENFNQLPEGLDWR